VARDGSSKAPVRFGDESATGGGLDTGTLASSMVRVGTGAESLPLAAGRAALPHEEQIASAGTQTKREVLIHDLGTAT
jgi:hypothetical protein